MILCSSEQLEMLPEKLASALKTFVDFYDPSLPLGNHSLGENFFILMEYDTVPETQQRYEIHKKYTDVQVMLRGCEMQAYIDDPDAGLLEDRLEESDLAFYKSELYPSKVVLYPGMVAVYSPGELHKPNCSVHEDSCPVRKAVIKISGDVTW